MIETRLRPNSHSLVSRGTALVVALCLTGCASKVLKEDNAAEILKNDEFDKAIQVKELSPDAGPGLYVRLPGPEPVKAATAPGAAPVVDVIIPGAPGGKPAKSKKDKKKKEPVEVAAVVSAVVAADPAPQPTPRQPSIEDSEGFNGRRPINDPYRVGEKVVLDISYFNVTAGDMILETRPFVEVNGRKAYQFVGRAISTSVFAMFYAVDDWFETLVDYETLVPYSYALHVKETKQLRETRSIFDWDKMKVRYWDKKIDQEKKVEEKRQEWDLPAYSQNVFSAAFYLRNFKLTPGKKIAFRVAHENENLVVTGEVIRRERISTPAGDFDTVIVKPTIALNGAFKPVGDIYFWLTDDDRKLIVKIESKIKIGKIVGVAKSVTR